MSSPRILITGGAGLLATALADTLRRRNLQPLAPPKAELDIANPAQLRDAFATHRPTVVYNCAAYTNVDGCETQSALADAVNGHAVGTLAALCREFDTYLIHVSTDYVFDGQGTRPYRPTDSVNPLSAYGRSKLLAEQLLQANPPARWIIARTAWVYGPGKGPSFPAAILKAARAGRPLRVVADQFGSPTYSPDLAQGLVALADANATGIFHVCNTGQASRFEQAKAVLTIFGLPDANVEPISSAQAEQESPGRAKRPRYSVLDTTSFTAATDVTPRPWQDGLADYRAAAALQ